jgi:glutaminase
MIKSPIQTYLENLLSDFAKDNSGEVASYIPALSQADPQAFGISVVTVDGHQYQVGDSTVPFSIQSMSKPFTYGMALEEHGLDYVLEKVGVEPSGDAFNSISLDSKGTPMNPMINAGAIAAAGMISGKDFDSKVKKLTTIYSQYAGRKLEIDEAVYESESATGHRNRAIGYMLRNFDILDQDPHETLELYFKQCSININCNDLAQMAATLANNGVNPITGKRALDPQYIEKVLSVMSTCGMYDYAGGWIYDIGLPAKSGVSGGIMAVLPGQFGIAIYSPLLDARGNSVRGIKVCERISDDFKLHIFDVGRKSTFAIRAAYDGLCGESHRIYCVKDERILNSCAQRIKIWELHGAIIFGSIEYVINEVISNQEELDYCVLDLKHVLSINSAATKLLVNLVSEFKEAKKQFLFSNMSHLTNLEAALRSHDFDADTYVFSNRLEAQEWCERQILQDQSDYKSVDHRDVDLTEQLLCDKMTDRQLEALRGVLVKENFKKGKTIFNEGDKANSLYFLQSGDVSIQLKNRLGKNLKVATLSAGTTFGEMALIERAKRAASIVCESDVSCLRLDFKHLDNHTVEYSSTIHMRLILNLARIMSYRLRRANDTIRAFD